MEKFSLCNNAHFLTCLGVVPAHDTNGADHHFAVVNMENWGHVDFIVFLGTSPRAAGVITIESCSNWVDLAGSPTTATKIPFQYYQRLTNQTTAANDVDSEIQTVSVAATGLVPTAGTDNIAYFIPLDSSQLISGHVGFRVDMVNPAAACTTTVMALLSQPRYGGSARPTVQST